MPSCDKHREQYLDNKRVFNAKFFNDQQNYNWKVTIIFYAAIHLIESSFPAGTRCNSHEDRHIIIDRSYKNIVDQYDNLYQLSIKARYKCIKVKPRDVTNALISLTHIENNIIKK